MSAEYSERRNHHRQPRPDFGHWCGTAYVLGTVEACKECGLPMCGPCRRGQHGCCDGGPYLSCECHCGDQDGAA